MLKRPTQAQIQGAAAPAVITPERASALVQHPLIKTASTGEILTPARVVEIMNGSPFNRDAAMLTIACLEGHGFTRDAEADKARGDKTVLMVNDGPEARVTIRLKSFDNERFGCYMDVIARTEYRVKVRQYMTKPSTPDFDFHDKYNEGKPMPLRVMTGRILQETKGMVKMELRGQAEPSSFCFKCGRKLTHPVSLLYGIGPECGEHYHINPFNSEEELQASYDEIKAMMAAVRWSGWVIRSAIESIEEVNTEA